MSESKYYLRLKKGTQPFTAGKVYEVIDEKTYDDLGVVRKPSTSFPGFWKEVNLEGEIELYNYLEESTPLFAYNKRYFGTDRGEIIADNGNSYDLAAGYPVEYLGSQKVKTILASRPRPEIIGVDPASHMADSTSYAYQTAINCKCAVVPKVTVKGTPLDYVKNSDEFLNTPTTGNTTMGGDTNTSSRNLVIEDAILINRRDASAFSEEELIVLMEEELKKAERLDGLGIKSKALERLRGKHNSNIEKLASILDSREPKEAS